MSLSPPSSKQDGPVMLKGSDLAFGLVALAAEIVVFAGVVWLVRELGGGAGHGTVLAGVVVIATGFLWATFMSPKGARRLPMSRRVLVAGIFALIVGAGLIAIDEARWGYVVLAAGAALSLVRWQIGERTTHRHRTPGDRPQARQ